MRQRKYRALGRGLLVLLLPLGLLNCGTVSPPPTVSCASNPSVCSQTANVPYCADKSPSGCRCFEGICLYRLNISSSTRCRCIEGEVRACQLGGGGGSGGSLGIQSCVKDTSAGGLPATKWDTCSPFP
jgi:hypothetical protein